MGAGTKPALFGTDKEMENTKQGKGKSYVYNEWGKTKMCQQPWTKCQ